MQQQLSIARAFLCQLFHFGVPASLAAIWISISFAQFHKQLCAVGLPPTSFPLCPCNVFSITGQANVCHTHAHSHTHTFMNFKWAQTKLQQRGNSAAQKYATHKSKAKLHAFPASASASAPACSSSSLSFSASCSSSMRLSFFCASLRSICATLEQNFLHHKHFSKMDEEMEGNNHCVRTGQDKGSQGSSTSSSNGQRTGTSKCVNPFEHH